MSKTNSKDFFSQKLSLLTEIKKLSEDMITSLKQSEAPTQILDERQVLIDRLLLLDTPEARAEAALSDKENDELDSLVNLIRSLDNDAQKMMVDERNSIIESLKKNTKNQRIANYGPNAAIRDRNAFGSKLDYKK